MPALIRLLSLVLALICSTSASASGNQVPKHALIISNSGYPREALPNALRDGQLMARTLAQLGFTVTERSDLNRETMMDEVARFASGLPEGATALVYYAGHGMQVGGGNYLTPIDMQLTGEASVPLKAYPVRHLLERLALARTAVNILILDACRNNPFQPTGAVRYRSFSQLGLAREKAPRGTLIAYSASPGQQAPEGRGKNSVYSEILAQTLLEPQLELRDMFDKVGNLVRRHSLDDQIPWYESSLTDAYYFQPPDGITVAAGKPLPFARVGRADRRARGNTAQSVPWFDALNGQEWDLLDWEIQQRAQRLTADELPLLEHEATGGSLVHQTTLGLVYREGVEKAIEPASGKVTRFNANNSKALKWLAQAAEAGFPIAQVELGEMYFAGHGVDRNLDTARHWIEQANRVPYTRARLDLFQLDNLLSTMEAARDPYFGGVRKRAPTSPESH
ncbi:MAG: caspase family protein [Dechloromonas agitata]|uniref:Caspase family protein n=1 Tax=Dechloromonas agitata TaxID=73030 RepID=A0A930BUN1_9RHOO|nr:caspase family protein [Dechloromonas agitata]